MSVYMFFCSLNGELPHMGREWFISGTIDQFMKTYMSGRGP